MEIVLVWKYGTNCIENGINVCGYLYMRKLLTASKYQTTMKITQKTKKQRTVGHECYTCWKHASGKQWSKEEGTLKEFIANRLVVKEHLKQELKPKGNDKRKNCHELFYF
jgi:hypothetical protein